MKPFRLFCALPLVARPPTRNYDEDRRIAREWMQRHGIHDVKPVYPVDVAPQPAPLTDQHDQDLTPTETLALLSKQAD